MNVNKKILDLNTIYSKVSLEKTIDILNTIKEAKLDLVCIADSLREDIEDMETRITEIMMIEEQITYIDKNIETLETAINLHQAKLFQKCLLNDEVFSFGLN